MHMQNESAVNLHFQKRQLPMSCKHCPPEVQFPSHSHLHHLYQCCRPGTEQGAKKAKIGLKVKIKFNGAVVNGKTQAEKQRPSSPQVPPENRGSSSAHTSSKVKDAIDAIAGGLDEHRTLAEYLDSSLNCACNFPCTCL